MFRALCVVAAAVVVDGALRAEMGVLAQVDAMLPKATPCAWDYENCKTIGHDKCIGPKRWGAICEGAFGTCGTGIHQSPIDIDLASLQAQSYTPAGTPLNIAYSSAGDYTLKNTGRGLEIEGRLGVLTCGRGCKAKAGAKYNAVAVHFHSPSEHTKKGEQFPLEMQVVHMREGSVGASDILIVSFLFNEDPDQSSPFLASLGANVPGIKAQVPLKSCDLNLLNGLRGGYVRYHGSVSTPPCEETVQYRIMAEVQPASKKQLAMFKAALAGATGGGNARPTQPVAGRVVEYVDVRQHTLDQWDNSKNFTLAKISQMQQMVEQGITPDLDANGGETEDATNE